MESYGQPVGNASEEEGATKREKKNVPSSVLKLKTENYRHQLNLKWVSIQFEITTKCGYIVEYYCEAIIGKNHSSSLIPNVITYSHTQM